MNLANCLNPQRLLAFVFFGAAICFSTALSADIVVPDFVSARETDGDPAIQSTIFAADFRPLHAEAPGHDQFEMMLARLAEIDDQSPNSAHEILTGFYSDAAPTNQTVPEPTGTGLLLSWLLFWTLTARRGRCIA